MQHVKGVALLGPVAGFVDILSAGALDFISALQREFGAIREELLGQRAKRQAELDSGTPPEFVSDTRTIWEGDWQVAPVPKDLQRRWVEITGPVERKMMINALNSGADVFMADFEDALSPSWNNLLQGQRNLIDTIERTITYASPDGKQYRLNDEVATLVVRPRGWHLVERHLLVDGQPVSASLFDFGLYFFHNACRLIEKGTGPYFYLPKLESHREARLWNEVFLYAQRALGIPTGTIKATVLIETILAAFEMEEILYELREHSAGLNAGRWDYIFSIIKKLGKHPDFVLPDRAQVTMTVPFMRAYTELLIKTCHRRGAHAIGGMAAYIPTRKDPEVNEMALAKVREDKRREAGDGYDGTWVAHPDLVSVAWAEFERVLGEHPNQIARQRQDVAVKADDLYAVRVPGGVITEAGLRNNVSVAIQYLESWLRGSGAVAIFNLMEDTATAEIARSQVWQWIHLGARLKEGPKVTRELVREIEAQELEKIQASVGAEQYSRGRFAEATALFERVALRKEFVPFLTQPAYELLE